MLFVGTVFRINFTLEAVTDFSITLKPTHDSDSFMTYGAVQMRFD